MTDGWKPSLLEGGSLVRCSRFSVPLGGVGFLTSLSLNNVRRHPWGGDLLDFGGGGWGATLLRAQLHAQETIRSRERGLGAWFTLSSKERWDRFAASQPAICKHD
jgi:hypothetical protein